MIRNRLVSLIILSVFVLVGCTAQERPLKAGQTKGIFRGTWWGYYERGRSFADAGMMDEAIQDFQAAIRLRNQDAHYARTYGVHFTSYYPNRELGCCFYAQGKIEQAKQALDASLKSAPTHKTEHFLELIIQKELLATREDTEAPKLALLWPPHQSDIFINRYDAVLEGEIEDDLRVTQMAINDARIQIQPGERTKFAHAIKGLDEGPNPVQLRAVDLTGKESSEEHVVVVDIGGPVVNLQAPIVESTATGKRVTVAGTVEDDNMLSSVKVGDRDLGGSHQKSVAFNETFEVATDVYEINILASDLAGNQSSGVVSLAPTPTPVGPTDTVPPLLTLPPDKLVFFTDMATLEIRAEDNEAVTSIEIAGRAIPVQPSAQTFTVHRVLLEEGENLIPIKVADAAGNVTQKEVRITKHSQAIKMMDARMALAMAAQEQDGSNIEVAPRMPDKLASAIVARDRFQVNLSETAQKDAVLQSKIHETAESIELVVRMVDPDTGTVMGIFDAFEKDKSEPTLKYLADIVAEKMENAIPVIEGTVAKVTGSNVVLTFGVDATLPKYSRCILYRDGEEIKDPNTGAVLGSLTEEIAELVVTNVQQRMVQARVKEMLIADATLAVGDKVITK